MVSSAPYEKAPFERIRRRRRVMNAAAVACLTLAAAALTPRRAEAQACGHTPPDLSICPTDMPAPEALDPVFLIGSASGEGYYSDCGLVDQLVACGWPRDKIFPIYREADPDGLEEGARAMFAEVESIRRSLGATKIDLLGYSLGGPRIWTYLTLMQGWRHARQVVLWASPNYGMSYTPYTREGGRNVVLPWHEEITEESDFNACVQGRSNDPACANPFHDFPPRAITAAQAAQGQQGTTYYNIYSADQPCHACTCTIWCDTPGMDQRIAHPSSDMMISVESTLLANAYNIRAELVAHWDFIQSDPRFYSTGFRWLERHATFRPSHNDVWEATMLGLLGRDPTNPQTGLTNQGDCATNPVTVTYGRGQSALAACDAPVRCGTLATGARVKPTAEFVLWGAAATLAFSLGRRRLKAA